MTIVAILLPLISATFASAQQNTPTISSRDKDLISEVLKENSKEKKSKQKAPALTEHDRALIKEVLKAKVTGANSNSKKPANAEKPVSEDKLLILDEEYLKAYHDWKLYKIEIAQQTFTFHFWSSLIIFTVVLGIVFMGLYLTWIQVTMRIDAEKLNQTKDETKKGDKEQHQLEISAEGLKLKSSVVGLSILTVSLAFFYLYLVYVYPVSFVGQQ